MMLQSALVNQSTLTTRMIEKYFASILKRIGILLFFVASLSGGAVAQSESCDYCKPKVWVGYGGSICSSTLFRVYFDGVLKQQAFGNCNGTFNALTEVMVGLTVDQTYTVQVTGACSTYLNFFQVPDGYKLEIDGVEKRTIDKFGLQAGHGDGVWKVTLRRKCECGNGPAGESAGPKLGSVMWDVGLGFLGDGRSAGSIGIHSPVLDAGIYTPLALVYSPPRNSSEVDVVLNPDTSLRQVKVPQSLVDIVVIDANQYELRFYGHADVGPKDQNGLYTISNQPYVKWIVSNPHIGFTDQLQISKVQGGVTDSSLYTWNSGNDSWSLTKGGGARTETKTKTVDVVTGDWTETFTVTNSLGQVVSKVSRTYHQFPWSEELIRETVDPDGAALATNYVYYQDSGQIGRYRRLKSVSRPDGSWEQYDYDVPGNRFLILRPWKDQPLASASESTSYSIRTTYANTEGYDISLYPRFVSSVVEKMAGTIVRKTTFNRTATTANGQPAVVETETVYASVSVSQITITVRYHSSASIFLANRIASIQYPDGRKDTYTYEKGDYVTNADPSLSQFTPNPSGLAERETIVHGTVSSPDGVAFKTTKEVTVRDQFGHTSLNETHVYTGSGYTRTTWAVIDYDSRGHLTQTRRSNGSRATAVWNGDLKLSETDENGIETTYTYDSLNRILTQTKKGVAASGSFPAQPDIVTTYTTDTEGRTTQETVAASGLSLTTRMSFDVAGRLKTETGTEGLTTTHVYTNGGRTDTVVLPGGATRITDKYFDGQIKSILGSAVVITAFDYGVNADGTPFTQEFVGSAGLSSPRWTKRSTDWMGRTVRLEKPTFTAGSTLIQASTYNSMGQLQSESVMVGVNKLQADKLYEYDPLGHRIRFGSDINGSGTLTLASTDRINDTEEIFEQNGGAWWRVTTNTTFFTDNSTTATVTGIQKERLTNFTVNGSQNVISEVLHTDEAGNPTQTTQSVDRSAKIVTKRTDTPASTSDAIEITFNGLLQSSGLAIPASVSIYTYDALGRPLGISNAASGAMTRAYSPTTGELISEAHGPQVTAYEYYPSSHPSAGRLKVKTDPTGKKVYFNYNSRGDVVQTWGDTTYPMEFVFDAYGQKTELHTFRSGSGWQDTSWPAATVGAVDVTRWTYQDATGLVTAKPDAANKQVLYTYDLMGRVATRRWARLTGGGNPIITTYSYDPNSGEMTGVSYSDGTQAVTLTYDRGGRQATVTDAAGTHTLTHSAAGQLLSDQISGGLLDQVSVTVGYDTLLRRNSLQSIRNSTTLHSQSYGYDASSRLETVISGGQTTTYAYYPTTGQLSTTTFTSGTQISRTYDSLGRLETIATSTTPAGTVASYIYTHNNLDQRTRVTREDNSYWSYGYNDRGELTSAKKYWSDNSPVAGQQMEYAFDSIGNRTSTKAGGDAQGLNLRQAGYTANSLNQYQQRTVPGALDIRGTANVAAIVTVNDQATYRRGDYFYKELTIDNSSAPAYPQVKTIGVRTGVGGGGEDAVSQLDGHVYVPKSAEVYSYDDDGNLTSDGRWAYTWDAENRLSSMEAIAAAPVTARLRLEFTYDGMGRRIQKKVYNWNAGTGNYQLQSTTKFVYDEWNLIAELDGSNTLTRSFVWSAAALLSIKEGINLYQVTGDALGNVSLLINSSSGLTEASYEYGPFGEPLKATGQYAITNPFRQSSKYVDQETGLVYYGHRFYNPATGRWISKDPIEQQGGPNLYAFVGNDGANHIDALGLTRVKVTAHAFIPWEWVKFPEPPPTTIVHGIASAALDFFVHGDGRGPGQRSGESARMTTSVEVELLEDQAKNPVIGRPEAKNKESVSELRTFGGYVVKRQTGTGEYTPVSEAVRVRRVAYCLVEVKINSSGNVPWYVGGPQRNIDYEYYILLRQTVNDKVVADISAYHDGFPGHEIFLESGGNVLYSRNYLPTWFAPQAYGPGTTAYPSIETALKGGAALAGQYNYQKWHEEKQF